jgi:Putative carbohydrate metabolism domain
MKMNKLYISFVKFTLATLAALYIAPFASAQEIPNANFENWAGGEPDSWNSTNMSVLFTQFTTVFQETSNPQSGTSCARLETVTKNILFVGPVTLPGVLTLGVLNIDPIGQTASISGGTPFTGMPQSLSGFIKYLPTTGDNCLLGIELTKWNNGVRDTIAYSFLAISNTANDWTAFNIPIEYLIRETPDTMNIGLISSNIADGLTHTGTKLWVDNLSLVYGAVSIEGINFPNELKIFADGSKRLIIVKPDFDKPKNAELLVYNISGQILIHQSTILQKGEASIDLNSLLPGTYIFRADIPGQKSFLRKFSILY